MEKWYVLQTAPGREAEKAGLLERAVDKGLYSLCCIPKRNRVFRSGGVFHILEDVMFPGYVFIRTAQAEELARIFERARDFPHFVCFSTEKDRKKEFLLPLEETDVAFLQGVCGEDLHSVMRVSRIDLNAENRIIWADGILNQYLDRLVKLNLHKRFAIAEVPLFHRTQPILFGIRLKQDSIMGRNGELG